MPTPMPQNMPQKERLEELLALARLYRNCNLKELAKLLGRDYHNLVPDGGVPKLDFVIRLAAVLDWSVQDVVDELCRPFSVLEGEERLRAPGTRGSRDAESAPEASRGSADARASAPAGGARAPASGDDQQGHPEGQGGAHANGHSNGRAKGRVVVGGEWAALDRQCFQLHQEGKFDELLDLAHRAYAAARTGDERARSCDREFLAWDGLGRYQSGIEAIQRGLREAGRSSEATLNLRVNLAAAHYALANFHEAMGVASLVLSEIDAGACTPQWVEGTRGFLHYVRGASWRGLANLDAETTERLAHARTAVAELTLAARLLRAEAERHGVASYRGVARTCEGGILEMRVLLGEIDAETAIEAFLATLEEATDLDAVESGDMLESLGWHCVFAATVVQRHLVGRSAEEAAKADQLMAIFTNKADEIAARLDNWSLREKVWTLELARRRSHAHAAHEEEGAWVIDREDIRSLAGAMARFPAFRETGWAILRESPRIEE